MSLIRMDYFSTVLNRAVPLNVILPLPRCADAPVEALPSLILLHGMGDDFTSWQRKTAIERYALEAGLAVVMPDGELSCYENMTHGGRFKDFIAHELPEVMARSFPISTCREHSFIAGCSMGGCGALKLALDFPEKWRAVGCFSAALKEYRPDNPKNQAMIARAFGGMDALEARDAQLMAEAEAINANGPDLYIWHGWGDADILKDAAQECSAFFGPMPSGALHYQAHELPGRHDWALWDSMAAHFIQILKLPKPEVRLL